MHKALPSRTFLCAGQTKPLGGALCRTRPSPAPSLVTAIALERVPEPSKVPPFMKRGQRGLIQVRVVNDKVVCVSWAGAARTRSDVLQIPRPSLGCASGVRSGTLPLAESQSPVTS